MAFNRSEQMHLVCRPASRARQRGFTLVELVMVMVLIGVLAVFVAPRINTTNFNARGFHDETLALLRYGQKAAIAQRRNVCVQLADSGVTLRIFADNPGVGACATAPVLTMPSSARGGTGLAGQVAGNPITSFQFTPLGRTDQATLVTITIANSSNIFVEAETGYVHE